MTFFTLCAGAPILQGILAARKRSVNAPCKISFSMRSNRAATFCRGPAVELAMVASSSSAVVRYLRPHANRSALSWAFKAHRAPVKTHPFTAALMPGGAKWPVLTADAKKRSTPQQWDERHVWAWD